jgi:L-ascorbate metabolism protein UlaG (beta-lactamase superfamily)
LNGLTWLGHSTVVFDLEGTRVVTDPVLRGRIWHLRRDAVDATAVGHLDAILVSHNHFDHLDLGSLDRLNRNLPVVLPRGVGGLVRRRGFARAIELDVGEEFALGAIRIRATHAEHESSRGPFSPRAPSLGYVLEGAAARIYFAGDTELFPEMRHIGPVDVALLPVSGWGPRLGAGHLDPAGAAEALRLLRPKAAVPIHWGTLRRMFSERPGDRPAREFDRIARQLAPEVDVRVLSIGETLTLGAFR